MADVATTTTAASTANGGNFLNTGGPALLNAGSTLLGTIAGYKANKKLAEQQQEWNEQMMDKQNEWSLNMWNKTNEYNAPSAQVARLRDAGLNPLYYGLDGSSANAFESAQALGYQRAEAPNFGNIGAAALEGAATAAQIRNIEADTSKKLTETKSIDAKLPFEVDNLRAQIRNSNLNADGQEIVNKYLDAQQQAELRVKNSTVAEADAMVQKAFAEIDKMDYEKLTMMQGWLETHERILNLQKQRDLTDKQIDELSSLIRVNTETANKLHLDVTNYDNITVIGTASHGIKVGPITINEGEPITLAMQKRIEEQKEALRNKQDKEEKTGDWRKDSAYEGPIYD